MNRFKRMALALLMLFVVAMPVFCNDSDNAGNAVEMQKDANDGTAPALGEGLWNGIYRWENPTTKNNKGKCTQIVFQVREVVLEDGEQAFEVWDCSEPSNPRIVFPVELASPEGFKWHSWKEDSVVADNYRTNAKKFNTTSYTPSKWRVKSVAREGLSGSCMVETKAFIFTVNTTNHFNLRYNSQNGTMELAFTMDGDGIASMGLFYNPAPGREGKKVFVLEKIK